MGDKRAIRSEIRLLTQQLSTEEKQREAKVVTRQIEDIIRQNKPTVVAAFMPLHDEIPIDIEHLSHLCRLIIPRISVQSEACEMEFFDYTPSAIQQGSFGIDEPQAGRAYRAEEIDLMIVPGVAFTLRGERLGRGKGFYDRYLSREGFRAQCIGVGFRHQLLQELPTEPHDHAMHKVITAKSE